MATAGGVEKRALLDHAENLVVLRGGGEAVAGLDDGDVSESRLPASGRSGQATARLAKGRSIATPKTKMSRSTHRQGSGNLELRNWRTKTVDRQQNRNPANSEISKCLTPAQSTSMIC